MYGKVKSMRKMISIIILAWNQLDLTRRCLDSIEKFTGEPYELILVDNGSVDGTYEFFRSVPGDLVIRNESNLGYARGNNQGIRTASGKYILLLNNDTVVTHKWLNGLLRCLNSSPDVGMVGPRSNYAAVTGVNHLRFSSMEGMHQFACRFNQPDPRRWFEVPWLPGFCLLIKREAIERVGLLDERFAYGFLEDVDYGWRVRQAGYRLLCAGDVFVYHQGSASFAGNEINIDQIWHENYAKFHKKWYGRG